MMKYGSIIQCLHVPVESIPDILRQLKQGTTFYVTNGAYLDSSKRASIIGKFYISSDTNYFWMTNDERRNFIREHSKQL